MAMNVFTIHIEKPDPRKRYAIGRFNGNLNVDVSTWNQREIRMRREDNRNHVINPVAIQDFGEGSEYGRAAREEARRKKFGRQSRHYNIDKQPWQLSVKDGAGKEKKYKSIVENTGEHADYWIFLKQGNRFYAHKVSEWYQFLPQVQHKILDIDQAEDAFKERNKVMNQFALKAQIQQQGKEAEEDGGKTVRGSTLIIKDKDIISSDDEEEEDEEGNEDAKKKRRQAKNAKPTKDKKQRVQNGDEVAAYESDDGDDEGREYDYMTDSGSDSDRETKTIDEKVDEAMVAVGDEVGLKQMIDSDEDSDEDEEKDSEGKDLKAKLDKDEDTQTGDKRESDDSEDEDLDSSAISHPLLLQVQKVKEENRKRPADAEPTSSTAASASAQPAVKKSKTEKAKAEPSSAPVAGTLVANRQQDALLEETIKRLLIRRPYTTKELLSIVRPRFPGMEKQEAVNKLANVLKLLGAKSFRKDGEKKGVLYFSLEA